MSVSLAMIPVVLIVRAAMGKDKFDEWVKSTELNMPTNFKDRAELAATVKKAGYDLMTYGTLLKTHVGSKKEFFFWEEVNGVWTAVFSKYDSQEMIKSFIADIEKCADRKVVYCSVNDIANNYGKARTADEIEISIDSNTEIFPTNFADKALLLKTLQGYGVNGEELENEDIQCKIENYILNFHKMGDSNYALEVKGETTLNSLYKHLTTIDEEYKHNVQEYTYKRVVEKISQSDMSIKNEEVMEDNSIVLTINIGG